MAFSSYRTCDISNQNNAVCNWPTDLYSLMVDNSDYVDPSDWNDNNFTTSHDPTFDEFNKMGITVRAAYFIFVNILTHCILIGITWALSRKCFELGLEKTAEHAYYCTLAFVLLIGECILMHAPHNPLTCWLSHLAVIIIHMLLGIAALVFGVYGVAVKYWHKEERKREERQRQQQELEQEEHSQVNDLNFNHQKKSKKQTTILHFRTNHGFYGIIGPVIFILTIVLGFLTFFLGYLKYVKSLHRVMAILSFLLLTVAQYFGYNTGFARRNLSEKSIKLYKCFTIILLYTTLNSSFRRMLHDFSLNMPQYVYDFFGLTN